MNNFLRILILTSFILIPQLKNLACTSFVVYANDIWYGMNLDYSEVSAKMVIDSRGGKKIFRTEFPNGNYFSGMNSEGLFTNFQMLFYNNETPQFDKEGNTILLGALRDYSLNYCSSVEEVQEYLGNQLAVPTWDIVLHSFFADTSRNAVIIEPFGTENGIVQMQNNFMVMTNFPNYDFIGVDYNEVNGAGSDRYLTACSYISEHSDDFGFNDGIEVLRKTVQTGGSYPTLVSLLYHPGNMEVFVCYKGDFNKIWRVSIIDQTVETYVGFEGYKKIPITESGVKFKNLPESSSQSSVGTESRNDFRTEVIYPNPSSGLFKILMPECSTYSKIEVFSSKGELVFMKNSNSDFSTEINLRGKPKGIYIVRIYYNDKFQSKKLVIH